MRRAFDGLAARFALLLTAALLVANLVALGLLASERERLGRAAREEGQIARVTALVPVLDAAAPAERRRIARAASRRGSRVRVAEAPLVAGPSGSPRTRAFAARLSDSLGGREVRLDAAGRGPSLALSIGLDGAPGWLNAVVQGGRPREPERGPGVLALVLGLSLAAVLGVGLIFVRQLTRPLAALAEAARAAGRGDGAARVPERGARELRQAAGAFNDMQARIARHEAERARTVAALGHDLRTPITSLRIRAEMLDDEAREPMVATLEEMRVMADGLVSYARGAGEGEARVAVDLAALLGRLCEERGARPVIEAQAAVTGRPVALGRALGNLIDNAARYGGGALARLSVDGRWAVISVEDDGPGIPPDRLEAVLEPFVRGEGSRSAETGGAGLGLSIARAVARSHGGALELANRGAGGLSATIRLPLA